MAGLPLHRKDPAGGAAPPDRSEEARALLELVKRPPRDPIHRWARRRLVALGLVADLPADVPGPRRRGGGSRPDD